MKFNKNKPYIDPRYFLFENSKEEMPQIMNVLYNKLKETYKDISSISIDYNGHQNFFYIVMWKPIKNFDEFKEDILNICLELKIYIKENEEFPETDEAFELIGETSDGAFIRIFCDKYSLRGNPRTVFRLEPQ